MGVRRIKPLRWLLFRTRLNTLPDWTLTHLITYLITVDCLAYHGWLLG